MTELERKPTLVVFGVSTPSPEVDSGHQDHHDNN